MKCYTGKNIVVFVTSDMLVSEICHRHLNSKFDPKSYVLIIIYLY